MSTSLRSATLVLALGVVSGACSGEEPPRWVVERQGSVTTTAPGAVVSLPELPGPGTPLLDGFVVPVGTRVLGGLRPFHQIEYRGVLPESSWTIQFIVDGDPRAAVDDVLDQAAAQDLEVRSNCTLHPGGVGCLANARRAQGGFVEEHIAFSARRDEGHQEGYLTYRRWPPDLYPEDRSPWGQDQSDRWTPATPLEFPPAEVAVGVPAPGEPFADQVHAIGGPMITVGEGSVVVGEVEVDWCTTGGFHALVYVPGDPAPVLEDYAAQFAAWGWGESWDEREVVQGIETARIGIYESGGGHLSLEAVIGWQGEGTWASIERCND